MSGRDESEAPYEIIDFIGSGSYGIVRKAIHRKTGDIVAIKYTKALGRGERLSMSANREILALKAVGSANANICFLRDVIRTEDNRIALVFPYCEFDLTSVIHADSLTNAHRASLMQQILNGLMGIHEAGIVHCDLKTDNILVDKDGNVRIADFGLARERHTMAAAESRFPQACSYWYRPPELFCSESSPFGEEVDVWAAGCILYEVATGKVLFQGRNDRDQLNAIRRVRGAYEHGDIVDRDKEEQFCEFLDASLPGELRGLRDLLLRMLSWHPKGRISARAALEDRFFRDHSNPWELPSLALAEMHQRRKKERRNRIECVEHQLHRRLVIAPPLCV
jgi:serine/threonine protein kinase